MNHFVPLAIIRQPHGVRGEVKIQSYTTPPEAVFDYALTDAQGVTFRIIKTGIQPKCFICRIEGISDRNGLERLKNCELGVPRDTLPPPEEGVYLISDFIGCAVYDEAKLPIGTVRDVVNYGASDIIVIDTMDGELLLPFTDSFFPTADFEHRVLICNLPDVLEVQEEHSEDGRE